MRIGLERFSNTYGANRRKLRCSLEISGKSGHTKEEPTSSVEKRKKHPGKQGNLWHGFLHGQTRRQTRGLPDTELQLKS